MEPHPSPEHASTVILDTRKDNSQLAAFLISNDVHPLTPPPSWRSIRAIDSLQSFRGGGVEGRITKLSGKTSLDESVFWGSQWGATRLEVTVSSDPPAPAHPIPTLGEWGLLAMNLLLALGGWASLRRKRA